MRAVDTDVLVRLIARDNPGQVASAEAFIREGAWISMLALAEAVWVLGAVYDLSPQRQIAAVEMLLNHRELVVQDAETVTAALELFRARPGLGFSDCLLLHSARKAGHPPLGTFDRNLARIAGTQKL